MSMVLLAFGLVMVVEGLAFALAPSRLEDALRALASLRPDQRRLVGLVVLAVGVGMVWLARVLGA